MATTRTKSKAAIKAAPQKAPVETVNINNKEYVVEHLPDAVKQLLHVYNTWVGAHGESVQALNAAKMEVAKNEAALRDLSREIVAALENENKA